MEKWLASMLSKSGMRFFGVFLCQANDIEIKVKLWDELIKDPKVHIKLTSSFLVESISELKLALDPCLTPIFPPCSSPAPASSSALLRNGLDPIDALVNLSFSTHCVKGIPNTSPLVGVLPSRTNT